MNKDPITKVTLVKCNAKLSGAIKTVKRKKKSKVAREMMICT